MFCVTATPAMFCEPVAYPMPSLPVTPREKGICCPGGGAAGAGTGWPNGPGTVLARPVSASCCDTGCAASAAAGAWVELGPAAASPSCVFWGFSPCWGCAAWSGWGGGASASASSWISSPPRGALYFLRKARASSLRHFCQATDRIRPSSHSMFSALFHLQSRCLLLQGNCFSCSWGALAF